MSTPTHDAQKSELITKAAELARTGSGSGGPSHDDVEDLLRGYYRHVAPEDLRDRSETDVFGALASQHKLAEERAAGSTTVRVLTPTLAEHGWSAAGHTVVEVVTDDMSFLVDSLTMELSRLRRDIHLVVHPTFDVVRGEQGSRVRVVPVADPSTEPVDGAVRESWMHVEIDRLGADEDGSTIADNVRRVLGDVRRAVEDWPVMQERIREIATGLRADPPPLSEQEVRQSGDLLDWLSDEHFTFLGYREYVLERVPVEGGDGGEDDVLRAVPGSGLGILRNVRTTSSSFDRLPDAVKAKARERTLLVLAKANSRATVHRPAYLDYVGVKTFGADGSVTGERRFLGLFSSEAYTESLMRIPLLREKAQLVLRESGFAAGGHAGKTLLDTLETFPRDELFHTSVEELVPLAEASMQARERRALRVFSRRDTYGRYTSVLVYLPRERYNTGVRERFAEILSERFGAESVEFNVRISDSTTARVHFVVHMAKGETIPDVELSDLERRLTEASRSWRDDFLGAVVAEYGEEVGSTWARRYVDSFPAAYLEDFAPRVASVDLGRLEAIEGDTGFDLSLYEPLDAGRGEARLKVYRIGPPLSLSQVLPMLSSMGVEVVDERPYELVGLERRSFVYEFGLRYDGRLPVRGRDLFQEALRAVWNGYNEIDGFNELVLAAGLTWRQATVLRAYAKYMRQGGSVFAQDYIEDALRLNVELTRMLVAYFETAFDPDETDEERRASRVQAVGEGIETALEQVASLDHDRILRSYLTHMRATLRTNFFQSLADSPRGHDGASGPAAQAGPTRAVGAAAEGPKPYISFKLEPSLIPDLPAPRPRFEIFVYSPRVEGVHLRFGAVARGGLRWSDRRDDFRTEVLGLVKAQMVKNTVIVPVGAKGGFFAKLLPDPANREAWLAEGVACYKTFISGLLDLTDNRVDGETVPPPRVVRHDGDDSYLVVAADKGTATFSDIANGVAQDYGFWLGDAFASGGSVGYDHKAMGITARGAWVSVQRHFRERGIDCQVEDHTCVGIGDMSGDVFGNGLLSSEHTALVAAFDHRDIFLDPAPDVAAAYAERERLFGLPRSSWADYDTSLISEGGGVFSRSRKSIPVSAQVREALGIAGDAVTMTPAELMRAILLAPVDLLWNGGIGTYVKASEETNADAGDKANDAIRVDGRQLRVRCVGEGGNLGLTQAGRIEFARRGRGGEGGAINTDFIDNSAGVGTSDREVNLKIFLDRVVAEGDLTLPQRNRLLAEMTDEVGTLVLRDNYEQNLALANAAANAGPLLHVHESWMKELESRGVLDRELEGLPPSKEVRRRADRGEGLTVPELSVLMAWTKIVLADELVTTDLPDDPYLDADLRTYFPTQVQERFGDQIRTHPLRREIIVTQVVNDLVNGAGFTYWPRLDGETGAGAAELTRANFVAREIFDSLGLREELRRLDNTLDASVQTHARVEMRTLVERASRWLLTTRRPPLDSQALVDRFSGPVQEALGRLPELMVGSELVGYESRLAALEAKEVPGAVAQRIALLPPAYHLLNVVEVALREERDVEEVARVHFTLAERLGLPVLVQRIVSLPRLDRWQTMARGALRDDLYAVHAQLTTQVLAVTSAEDSAPARIAAWEDSEGDLVAVAAGTLTEICADEQPDLARMSVGLRVVRGLLP